MQPLHSGDLLLLFVCLFCPVLFIYSYCRRHRLPQIHKLISVHTGQNTPNIILPKNTYKNRIALSHNRLTFIYFDFLFFSISIKAQSNTTSSGLPLLCTCAFCYLYIPTHHREHFLYNNIINSISTPLIPFPEYI